MTTTFEPIAAGIAVAFFDKHIFNRFDPLRIATHSVAKKSIRMTASLFLNCTNYLKLSQIYCLKIH
jgi:hypothetical protein